MKRFLFAATALALSASAFAQDAYPSRPITMVVGFQPGGGTDTVARILAKTVGDSVKQQVLVENKAGAGGNIATDYVAKAAPDGHTVLAVFDSFVSNPHVFRNAPYDVVKDFAPVSMMIRGPQLLVVHPGLGVRTFPDFLSLAKSRRTPLNFATAGAATSSRLSQAR